MINFQFDTTAFREMIREEVQIGLAAQKPIQIKELPPLLTKEELKELFHIKDTKAAELLARADFPVLREAGTLIPTHLLMRWIEDNTQWINKNAKSFKAIS
ncbi:DNA-binding protein [Lysinibacillus sp. KU-BSD001]